MRSRATRLSFTCKIRLPAISLTTVTVPSTTKPSSARCWRTSSLPVILRMVTVSPGLAIVIGTDVLKTVIAVVAGGLIMGTQGAASTGQVFAGFCVMLGHIYPVFYGFRGGKGVLCAETMLLIVSFPTGLVSLLIFVGIVWATRYVSLGSICGALIAPIGVLAACGKLPALLSLFCVILLVVKHRSNIGRLIRHKESKLSFKKDLSDKFDDEDF